MKELAPVSLGSGWLYPSYLAIAGGKPYGLNNYDSSGGMHNQVLTLDDSGHITEVTPPVSGMYTPPTSNTGVVIRFNDGNGGDYTHDELSSIGVTRPGLLMLNDGQYVMKPMTNTQQFDYNGAYGYISTDLVNWNTLPTYFQQANIVGSEHGGPVLLFSSGTVYATSDGVNWTNYNLNTKLTSGKTTPYYAAAQPRWSRRLGAFWTYMNPNNFYTTPIVPTCFATSPDGVNWTVSEILGGEMNSLVLGGIVETDTGFAGSFADSLYYQAGLYSTYNQWVGSSVSGVNWSVHKVMNNYPPGSGPDVYETRPSGSTMHYVPAWKRIVAHSADNSATYIMSSDGGNSWEPTPGNAHVVQPTPAWSSGPGMAIGFGYDINYSAGSSTCYYVPPDGDIVTFTVPTTAPAMIWVPEVGKSLLTIPNTQNYWVSADGTMTPTNFVCTGSMAAGYSNENGFSVTAGWPYAYNPDTLQYDFGGVVYDAPLTENSVPIQNRARHFACSEWLPMPVDPSAFPAVSAYIYQMFENAGKLKIICVLGGSRKVSSEFDGSSWSAFALAPLGNAGLKQFGSWPARVGDYMYWTYYSGGLYRMELSTQVYEALDTTTPSAPLAAISGVLYQIRDDGSFYKYVSGAWVACASFPYGISGARYSCFGDLGGIGYVIGGYADQPGAYDPATDSWSPVAADNSSYTTGTVSDGSLMYTWNGPSVQQWKSLGSVGDFFMYDPTTDKWTARAPGPAVSHAGSAVIGNKLYVVGGRDTNGAYQAGLHRYDPDTDTWTELAPTLGTISDPAVVAANGKLFILGGEQQIDTVYQPIEHAWIYDPDGDSWSASLALPAPHTAAGAANVDDYLYVPGGLLKGYHAHAAEIDGFTGGDDLYSDVLTVWMAPPKPIVQFSAAGGGWIPLAV